jgi:hypothetical protein
LGAGCHGSPVVAAAAVVEHAHRELESLELSEVGKNESACRAGTLALGMELDGGSPGSGGLRCEARDNRVKRMAEASRARAEQRWASGERGGKMVLLLLDA